MSSLGLENSVKIASNRLPVSVSLDDEGQYAFSRSSGGLVTGLGGLKGLDLEYTWYGWPGIEIPHRDLQQVTRKLREEHSAVPVLLDQQLAERYYDGFSNSTVWPLLHYQLDKVSYDEDTTAAYRKANQVFADTIVRDLKEGDLVWIQDYHLMLLPELLRQRAREMKVSIRLGFFLHTPFPGEEFFTTLPSKNEILDGILGSDVIGFHTDEYRRHFLDACSEVLGLRLFGDKLKVKDHEVTIQTLPIGIEPSDFQKRLDKVEVQEMIRSTRNNFSGLKILVGVDRLDYIKGIPQKLQAMDEFFQIHPDQIGRVVLVQVTIPSRANLELNQKLRTEVQELVGKVNGKYGNVNYVPVHFLYKTISPDELTALYAAADVCFVSSTRDGLNLVSYEYVACHDHDCSADTPPGVLLLSKFAGASSTLKGCLLVNPWDKNHCADAVAQALTMEPGEAMERMKDMRSTVDQQTSFKWAVNFLRALDQKEQEAVDSSLLSSS
ncbi:Trehalose-6-P synthase/phosphatase complex synthase subunit [Vermiconidia calcicola]|uniref:Trehalose-6-P synthase/phosphatase complex synthase subunit n=1 Tax=Vermiconidia calcicola TaxID=1690605 RepID=A0ACC3NTI0_9PEZI|nr:Trehalose-6-P synthase/phosphatase complex synthase subunit [Vermiconidia calcicola]